jgi:hypothetical protein
MDSLRALLIEQAKSGSTVTYAQLALRLALRPPQTIHRVALALERLMEEDAEAGRPLLAALVVSRTHPGRPAAGFFEAARRIGAFSGEAGDEAAFAFHDEALSRAIAYYRA